ncbi:MAG TPA: hypothetical protein VK509_08020 [Polyangiales bacterium]|nr:hypothetical protein [Polyangiales bacterium]
MNARALRVTLLLAPLLLTLLLQACDRITGWIGDAPSSTAPKVETFVREPHTLAALRKQAEATGSRFEQRERNDRWSGTACHGQGCLLLAPFLAVHVLAPNRWFEVEVDGGSKAASYRGTFQADGSLISMKVEQAGVAREIALLELPTIERRLVVEIARRAPGAKGDEPAWPRTPITAQVDLRPDYAEAVTRATDPAKKSEVLSEAFALLDAEALPLLTPGLLADAPDVDRVIAAWLDRTCEAGSVQLVQALIALTAQSRAGDAAARSALACVRSRPADLAAKEWQQMALGLFARLCNQLDDEAWWQSYDWLRGETTPYLGSAAGSSALVDSCLVPLRRASLRIAFKLALEPAELAHAFASRARGSSEVGWSANCADPLVGELAEQAVQKDATPAALGCLRSRTPGALAAATLTALARAYVAASAAGDAQTTALIRQVFRAAHADRSRTAAARALLERAQASAAPGQAPTLALALSCLSDLGADCP